MESDLANLYLNTVRYKGQIPLNVGSSFNTSSFERDPHFIKLEQSVFSQISELTKENETVRRPENKSNGLRTVSLEDAIKELKMLESNELEQFPIV